MCPFLRVSLSGFRFGSVFVSVSFAIVVLQIVENASSGAYTNTENKQKKSKNKKRVRQCTRDLVPNT